MTLELLSKEEQGSTATPMYSSRDEYKIATTTRKEGKPGQRTLYNPLQKISIPPDTKCGKKRHPNYKPQNVILNKKYVCLLEVHCGFLQGREARHINMPTKKSIKLSSGTLEQGLVKEDNNEDEETRKVEDKNMKYLDEIDNHNVNINCQ